MESASPSPASDLTRILTLLIRRTLWHDFSFPRGYVAQRAAQACTAALERSYGALSPERMADFCICQAFAISGFEEQYRRRWRPAHSCGSKALERFAAATPARRYYEDRWLEKFGLSRQGLAAQAAQREHPLARFIYPEWEETTKRRLLGSQAGYLICGCSTLLWAPQSPACGRCPRQQTCRVRTQRLYPELYRLRCEASTKHE